MWVGLLIFYVTNETNETNVHFAAFCGKNTEFCRILRQPFPLKSRTFAPNFKAR